LLDCFIAFALKFGFNASLLYCRFAFALLLSLLICPLLAATFHRAFFIACLPLFICWF
jgi:hypothetical protein